MLKCNACGGTYEPIQADGTQYFHRCPPLSRVELAAAIAAATVVLPLGESVETALSRRTYARRQARDENVIPSRDPQTPATIKAEGRGVTDLGPLPRPDAPVIVDV